LALWIFISTIDGRMKLLRIGFGNAVIASRVKQIVKLKSAEGKRWKQEADQLYRLIDATAGRHTRSMLITDSGHIILSSISPRQLEQKLRDLK
jgi:extracellular matrix regulatory protein A